MSRRKKRLKNFDLMSLLTTIIDDKSPLISYSTAAWAPGTAVGDPDASEYYLGTFQKNNSTDGSATFNFNWSTVWIYGAYRGNHGLFTVQMDSITYPSVNGFGNSFQQVLFTTDVSQGMHTITITNTNGSSGLYLDIDMIVWQSEVGNVGEELVPELVQDVDPRFQYQPGWETTSGNLDLNLFNNGTGHVTNASGASVSFTFTGALIVLCLSLFILIVSAGEAVTLFGTSGQANGQYSVQLDGGTSATYNASNGPPNSYYGVAIYHADNLGPGTHQLVLINLPSPEGQSLAIDYAQLWAVANGTEVIVSPSDPTQTTQVIAGLIIEGLIALLAAAAAVLFYRRWKAAFNTPHTYYAQFRSLEQTRTGNAPPLATTGRSRQPPTASTVVLGNPASNLTEPELSTDNTTREREERVAGWMRPLDDELSSDPFGDQNCIHGTNDPPPVYETVIQGYYG